jgi:hypothetical protein
MKKTAILLAATLMTSTAAYASEWGSRSLRLSDDMTEQQAINAVGYLPSSAELKTCGQQSSTGEWTCKTLRFGSNQDGIFILLQRSSDGLWMVNSWGVLP